MILFPSSALPTLSPSAFLVSNPEKDSFICEKDLTRTDCEFDDCEVTALLMLKSKLCLTFFLDFECDVAGIRRLTWHATGPNLKDQSSSRCPRTRSRGRGWRTKTHTGQP